MSGVTRLSRAAMACLGLVAMVFAGCTGPAAAPPPAATNRPSPPSPPSGAASASPSASLLPSPALPTASARPSPAAGVSPSPSASLAPATPVAAEQPVAPETNPAGDIPDTQVFVAFASPTGGYQLQVPEGWARTDSGADVRFVNKLDGVRVAVTSAPAAPTAAGAQAADLQRSGRAVQVTKVQDVQLPAGPAVMLEYTSNSDPDPVTNKQVRLENNAYLFYQNGKLARLTLWAPLGADNVDQWQQMAQSFRWQ